MNIHEYQAKQILSKYGIKVPKGKVAYTPLEAKTIAGEISLKGPWMIKSQIHSGARNKGYFLEKKAGKDGGIRQVKTRRSIAKEADEMLGSTLVTVQTGHKGKVVHKVYVEEYVKIDQTFYCGMVIDRMTPAITLLVCDSNFDDDIIRVALSSPDKILRTALNLENGATVAQVRNVLNFLNLPANSFKNLKKFIDGLHKAFVDNDATMIEVNPVGVTKRGELMALDAKMSFDDSAMFRHKDISMLRDESEYIERKLKALKYGFNYGEFDGSVGLIVNGDGISLALIDLLRQKDFDAACFLNVKGGVDKDKIAAGIKLIMTNPRVEGILINILGGFLRCNLIAEGIVASASEVGLNVPLVVRFEGINKEYAKEILVKSSLPLKISDEMETSVNDLLELMREGD
ncbi:MAG: ADP-forming succinate--CoA ligase subunit beta [Lactobacillaceae bacterium]|jgi:succinyl-CoA synthetase beta subunit|nr:ADP-forming succinate--CoA ligase subunit beta [Lactobacillaceae bacterium]